MSNIGLGLVVIVIGDKIFHRIFRKEFPELTAQLGRQCLVMGQHQGRPVQLGNHRRHGKGFSGPGYTQKGLLPQSPVHPIDQPGNGLWLISGGFVFRNQFELIHFFSSLWQHWHVKPVAGLNHGYIVPFRNHDVIGQVYLHRLERRRNPASSLHVLH